MAPARVARSSGLTALPADLCNRISNSLDHKDSRNLRLVCRSVVRSLQQTATTCIAYHSPTPPLPSSNVYVSLTTVKLVLGGLSLSRLFGAWKFVKFETFQNEPAQVTLTRESAEFLLKSGGAEIPQHGFSVSNVTRASFLLRNDSEVSCAVGIVERCVGVTDVSLKAVVPRLQPVPLLRLQQAVCLVAERLQVREVCAPALQYASLPMLQMCDSPLLVNLRIHDFRHPILTHPASYSNLKRLVVDGAKKDHVSFQLQHMPVLEDLILGGMCVSFVDPRNPLQELPRLDVALFNLCSLENESYHNLVEAWEHHPSLRRMDIIAYADDEDMFDELEYLRDLTGATAWMEPSELYAEITIIR